jgi:hypothetical protein
MKLTFTLAVLLAAALSSAHAADDKATLIRSAKSGAWSDAATWDGGKVPGPGARVQVRAGHTVRLDAESDDVIRSIHVAGVLSFASDRNTRLNVGLIKIQPGDDASEDGFDCDAHSEKPEPGKARPALEIGTQDRPLDPKFTATIRLALVEGLDKESCPAIVCCGGRMDFHGAPMGRTWLKLGGDAKKDDDAVSLAEEPAGWRVGDRVIVVATERQHKESQDPTNRNTFKDSTRDLTQTEERVVKAIDGKKLTLDKPLAFDHRGDGAYRGEVANLSRNVVIESADPAKARGHTMYHRDSAGSISYAEFRHLGKEGILGKYSIHYHLCGDTMRGSYVLGASVWDSGNRWLTIHGTNYLVVRDCVGYRSVGHGFFLEDGTEVFNVLDRNLAVQAYIGKPLPKQTLPYDKNDGSGFWWANCHNSFTRNVAAECDEYGYFFQVTKTPDFDPVLPVRQPDGSLKKVDVRTLPFVRFEDNEAHSQRRHALNIGGGAPFGPPNAGGVGPDEKHPFVLRNTKLWNVHWAFHPVSPTIMVDAMDVNDADYGVWRPVYSKHAYRGISLVKTRVAEFSAEGTKPKDDAYPGPLAPVDDRPPVTVIMHVRFADGMVLVRGVTADDGEVKKVLVNGVVAKSLRANFAEWEAVLDGVKPGELKLKAHAEDAAGNVEKTAHEMSVTVGK